LWVGCHRDVSGTGITIARAWRRKATIILVKLCGISGGCLFGGSCGAMRGFDWKLRFTPRTAWLGSFGKFTRFREVEDADSSGFRGGALDRLRICGRPCCGKWSTIVFPEAAPLETALKLHIHQ
jgi:hypothetical protein